MTEQMFQRAMPAYGAKGMNRFEGTVDDDFRYAKERTFAFPGPMAVVTQMPGVQRPKVNMNQGGARIRKKGGVNNAPRSNIDISGRNQYDDQKRSVLRGVQGAPRDQNDIFGVREPPPMKRNNLRGVGNGPPDSVALGMVKGGAPKIGPVKNRQFGSYGATNGVLRAGPPPDSRPLVKVRQTNDKKNLLNWDNNQW